MVMQGGKEERELRWRKGERTPSWQDIAHTRACGKGRLLCCLCQGLHLSGNTVIHGYMEGPAEKTGPHLQSQEKQKGLHTIKASVDKVAHE